MLKSLVKSFAVGLFVAALAGGFLAGFLALCHLGSEIIMAGGILGGIVGFAFAFCGYNYLELQGAVWTEGEKVIKEAGALTERIRKRAR